MHAEPTIESESLSALQGSALVSEISTEMKTLPPSHSTAHA